MRHLIQIVLASIILVIASASTPCSAQRRITPVKNAATTTMSINELSNDTAYINANRRARMTTHYLDGDGNIVYVDTITGEEWVDSVKIKAKKIMVYPLIESVTVGLNIWDPLMRVFGQKYGGAEVSGELSLYNRYKPIIELGLGTASNTPDDGNFTYKTPLAPYARIGVNYNFLYNSTPDYQFYVGLRYGFTSFNFDVTDVSVSNGYWNEPETFNIPRQKASAGFCEFVIGLKVQLFKNISAGWALKYHSILHESTLENGEPWYIPGYGSRNGKITGALSIMYRLPLNKPKNLSVEDIEATLPPVESQGTTATDSPEQQPAAQPSETPNAEENNEQNTTTK
jgi:hypothetical protein